MTSAISSPLSSIYSGLFGLNPSSSAAGAQQSNPLYGLLEHSPATSKAIAPSTGIDATKLDLPSDVLSLLQEFSDHASKNMFDSLVGNDGGQGDLFSKFTTRQIYDSVGADLTAAAYYGHAAKAYDAVNAGVSHMVNQCSTCVDA